MADASSSLSCSGIPLGCCTSVDRPIDGMFVNKSPENCAFANEIHYLPNGFRCLAFFGHLCYAVRINASLQWKAGCL